MPFGRYTSARKNGSAGGSVILARWAPAGILHGGQASVDRLDLAADIHGQLVVGVVA